MRKPTRARSAAALRSAAGSSPRIRWTRPPSLGVTAARPIEGAFFSPAALSTIDGSPQARNSPTTKTAAPTRSIQG